MLRSPFAEPDDLPNWLADWFVETVFVDSASTLRLVSRAWAQFVQNNATRLRLRLDRASNVGEASLVEQCRRLAARFPSLAEVDCGPSPTDNAEVAAAALGALAQHLPQLKALDASQWTLLSAEALSGLHQGCGQLHSLTLRLERVSLGAAAAALAPLSALASLDIRAVPEEEGQLRLLPASLTSLSLGCFSQGSRAKIQAPGDWDDAYGGCQLPASWLLGGSGGGGSGAPGSGPQLSDGAFLAVAQLPRLEALDIEVGRASHVGIAALAQLSTLHRLTCRLRRPSADTSSAIREVAGQLPRLKEVVVVECGQAPAPAPLAAHQLHLLQHWAPAAVLA